MQATLHIFVYLLHACVMQKRLNGSTSCLGCRLSGCGGVGAQGTPYSKGRRSEGNVAFFVSYINTPVRIHSLDGATFNAAVDKLLWSFVAYCLRCIAWLGSGEGRHVPGSATVSRHDSPRQRCTSRRSDQPGSVTNVLIILPVFYIAVTIFGRGPQASQDKF